MRVVTGSRPNSKADTSKIRITLVGDKGTSNAIAARAAECFLPSHFKQATYEDILIESEGDLGEILVVEPCMCHSGRQFCTCLCSNILALSRQWFVNFITVYNHQDNMKPTNFPCYHWVGHGDHGVTCTSATGELCTCSITFYMHICCTMSKPDWLSEKMSCLSSINL